MRGRRRRGANGSKNTKNGERVNTAEAENSPNASSALVSQTPNNNANNSALQYKKVIPPAVTLNLDNSSIRISPRQSKYTIDDADNHSGLNPTPVDLEPKFIQLTVQNFPMAPVSTKPSRLQVSGTIARFSPRKNSLPITAASRNHQNFSRTNR